MRPEPIDGCSSLPRPGRHVELRLIGTPAEVDAVLDVLAMVLDVTAGTRKATRDRDGRVIQYATATAPASSAPSRVRPADASDQT